MKKTITTIRRRFGRTVKHDPAIMAAFDRAVSTTLLDEYEENYKHENPKDDFKRTNFNLGPVAKGLLEGD